MPSVDLDSLIAGTQSSFDVFKTALSDTLGITGKAAEIANTLSEGYSGAAKDASLVTQVEGMGKLRQQAANRKAASIFGTDLESQTEVVTGLSEVAAEAYKDQQAALGEIQKKHAISIFDDPIGAITALLTINKDIDAHNDAENRHLSAVARIQEINANTQTTIQTQNAIAETINTDALAAKTRLAGQEFNTKAAEAQLKSLQFNLAGIAAVKDLTKDQLASMFQLNTAQNAATQIDIGMAHLALSRDAAAEHIREFGITQARLNEEFAQRTAEHSAMMEDRRANREDRQKTQAEKDRVAAEQQDLADFVVQRINTGRAARGVEPLSGINAKQAVSLLGKHGPDGAGEIGKDYLNGDISIAANKLMLGATPSQAAATVLEGRTNLPEVQKPIAQFLSNARDEFAKAHATPGTTESKIDDKDKKGLEQAFNNFANKRFAETFGKVDPKAAGLTAIGSINDFITQGKGSELESLPIWTKVLKPIADTGVALDSPSAAFGYVSAALKEGKITMKEASELSTIYSFGVAYRMASQEPTKFGLKIPSEGFSYNVKVPVNPLSFFGGEEYVNLSSSKDVTRALMRRSAITIQSESMLDKTNPLNVGNEVGANIKKNQNPQFSGVVK